MLANNAAPAISPPTRPHDNSNKHSAPGAAPIAPHWIVVFAVNRISAAAATWNKFQLLSMTGEIRLWPPRLVTSRQTQRVLQKLETRKRFAMASFEPLGVVCSTKHVHGTPVVRASSSRAMPIPPYPGSSSMVPLTSVSPVIICSPSAGFPYSIAHLPQCVIEVTPAVSHG